MHAKHNAAKSPAKEARDTQKRPTSDMSAPQAARQSCADADEEPTRALCCEIVGGVRALHCPAAR